MSWFQGLGDLLQSVEEEGFWPVGLLVAYIAITPKVDEMLLQLVRGRRVCCRLSTAFGLRFVWVIWKSGSSSVEAWYATALDVEEVLAWAVEGQVHIFVVDMVKTFDTVDGGVLDCVDRGVLDCVLSNLALPVWFRHVHFEYDSNVRFILAIGRGEPWTTDGLNSSGVSSQHDVHRVSPCALVQISIGTSGG